jgi:anaerobic ribonucleoside-triphosphate reductase activating protein
MNILYIDFTLKNKSLDIYVAGCNGNPHCKDCHNPESWDFDQGAEYNNKYISYIKRRIEEFDLLIDNIMIMGGEPLDQDYDELIKLLSDLKKFNKNIWLFTRYEIEEIPDEIIGYCNYIKTGKYIPELEVNDNIQNGIKLATSNQKIYKIEI